jgi:transcriptional regulator with XRE-family HTH domain
MNGTRMERRTAAQRRALGDFLRAQREKLVPAAVGLAGTGRRRTPGLRREEVAQLSGLSATWYSWIEQGRDVSVSPSALARLASALRLGSAERDYLFALAEKRDPARHEAIAEAVPAAMAACVEAMHHPAYILDAGWTLRHWNEAAARLFAGWLDQPGDRNLLRFVFTDPVARTLIDGWEERARRVVAEFRASGKALLMASPLRDLITELRASSAEFARLWDEHGVLGREGGERRFRHPSAGQLSFEQVTFELAGHPALKLTVLVPANDAAAFLAQSALAQRGARNKVPPVKGCGTPVVPGKLKGKPLRARSAI